MNIQLPTIRIFCALSNAVVFVMVANCYSAPQRCFFPTRLGCNSQAVLTPLVSRLFGQITDKALERLSTRVKGLNSVNLNGCQRVTPAGVRALLATNPHLWHLIILNCERISQQEADAILRQFPSITRNSPASAPSI